MIAIAALYFGADHFLSRYLKAGAPTPEGETAIVQNMAKFLEQSPDFQRRIQEGQASAPSASHPSKGADLTRYFGSSPSDQYFKSYVAEKLKTHPDDADGQTRLFNEVGAFIQQHPKESVESLENALQAIPLDLKVEREAITPVFIHAAIGFLEETTMDESTKRAYLKRFMDHTQSPEVRAAFESHFPELLEK